MNIILLLSWRFIRGISSHHVLTRIGLWCFLSIAISAGSLALIGAIAQGIEQVTLEKLKGLSPDIIISAPFPTGKYQSFHDLLTQDYGDTLQTISPVIIRHGILQDPANTTDVSTPITLMIIDPLSAFKVIHLPLRTTCAPHRHILTQLIEGTILLGDTLAQRLNLHCQDTTIVRYPTEQSLQRNVLMLDSTNLKVAGIFATGLSEWDNQVAFISHETAKNLFDDIDDIEQVYIQLKPSASLTEIQQQLSSRFHIPIVTWKDLNPAIHTAMHLERIALMLILGLIALMTGMSTMSLISLLIISHQTTLAILLSLGMPQKTIKKILISTGLMVTWCAAGVGLLIATLVSWILNTYHLIALPDVYYSSYLPAHMSATILVSIFILVSLVSVLATWYPSQQLNTMRVHNLLLR